jgi:L-arabinose isomerase
MWSPDYAGGSCSHPVTHAWYQNQPVAHVANVAWPMRGICFHTVQDPKCRGLNVPHVQHWQRFATLVSVESPWTA